MFRLVFLLRLCLFHQTLKLLRHLLELVQLLLRELAALQQWEGDRIFLQLMDEHVPFFSLKLVYAGDTLTEAVLNGERIR
mgnify:CR=1 FL=1